MMMGHNSEALDEKAMEILTLYSESLERSDAENDTRKDLRDRYKELGQDTKALQDGLRRIKASLREREGYDEGMAYIKELSEKMGGAENIFSWYVDKQEAKDKEREEKKADKKKAKANGKSVGQKQAEAVQEAWEAEETKDNVDLPQAAVSE